MGPLTWQLGGDVSSVLSRGRQRQFGFDVSDSVLDTGEPSSDSHDSIHRSLSWEVPPHPAYFLPFLAAPPHDAHPSGYALYCDVLLLLTALDGGEHILDKFAQDGAGTIPFEDRWNWRSRIHLPMDAWQAIHDAIRWIDTPSMDHPWTRDQLREALTSLMPDDLALATLFGAERVDLATTEDAEIIRTIRPAGAAPALVPKALKVHQAKLQKTLRVRVAQIDRWASKDDVVTVFPRVPSAVGSSIMEQVAAAFQVPSHGRVAEGPELVLLPEVSVPQPEVRTVRELVRETGRASLAGLYWRVLSPVYRPAAAEPSDRYWFVNEAELVLPVGFEDGGPTGVRWYRVRKPRTAHLETGLARAVRAEQGGTWEILEGHRWYRFVHPSWGDFSIVICSDLLDTAPWNSLLGELLHLFMVSFNNDVGLFEALTWVRAYENFVNLVSVNHGTKGGSFVWTPRRAHGREVARVHGEGLFVLADVEVPVSCLFEAQVDGVTTAVVNAEKYWTGVSGTRSEFKAPPPGFERRSFGHDDGSEEVDVSA